MYGYRIGQEVELFPAWYGESKCFSPRMITYKKNLDCNKYLAFTLDGHMQDLNKPNKKNANALRTLDCLFLRPKTIKQGGCKLLHLSLNKTVIERKI